MDYGTFRGIFTLVLLILFIGLIGWAWSRNRKQEFDEAANLIFDQADKPSDVTNKKQESENE